MLPIFAAGVHLGTGCIVVLPQINFGLNRLPPGDNRINLFLLPAYTIFVGELK